MLSNIFGNIKIPSVSGVTGVNGPVETPMPSLATNPLMLPALMGINGQNILEGSANRQVHDSRQHVLDAMAQPAVQHPTMQNYTPSKGDMLAMALIGLAGNLSAPNSQVGTQALNTWISLRDSRAQKEWQNAEILARNKEAQQQADLARAQFEYNSAINQREDLQTQILRQDQRQEKIVSRKEKTMDGLVRAITTLKEGGLPGATRAAYDRAYAYGKANGLNDSYGLTPEMRDIQVREAVGTLFTSKIKPTYDQMLKTAKASGELTDDGAKKINDWLDAQKKYYGIPDDYALPYVDSFTTQARKAAVMRNEQFNKTFGLKKQDLLNKWAYQDSRIAIMREQLQINWNNSNTFYENAITNRDRANAYVLAKRLKSEIDVNRKQYEKVLGETRKVLAKYQGFQSDAEIDAKLKMLEDNIGGIPQQVFQTLPKDAQDALMQYKWARDWLSDNPPSQDPDEDMFNQNPAPNLQKTGPHGESLESGIDPKNLPDGYTNDPKFFGPLSDKPIPFSPMPPPAGNRNGWAKTRSGVKYKLNP